MLVAVIRLPSYAARRIIGLRDGLCVRSRPHLSSEASLKKPAHNGESNHRRQRRDNAAASILSAPPSPMPSARIRVMQLAMILHHARSCINIPSHGCSGIISLSAWSINLLISHIRLIYKIFRFSHNMLMSATGFISYDSSHAAMMSFIYFMSLIPGLARVLATF